jgi:fructokinase
MSGLYGAIEAGGTKFVCAVARDPASPLALERFPTLDPAQTIARAVAFFESAQAMHGRIDAFCVASFGPVAIDPGHPECGRILATPKPGWAGADLLSPLAAAFRAPVRMETDVNAALVGEARRGAARGYRDALYLTVGTGIGGGAMVGGKLVHGRLHPEMGHIQVDLEVGGRRLSGICPFHGACLEGLASGPAIKARWGLPAEDLGEGHPAWVEVAAILGRGLASLSYCFSPSIIVLGGGVPQAPGLIGLVEEEMRSSISGYIEAPLLRYAGLGQNAGIVGALELAQESL